MNIHIFPMFKLINNESSTLLHITKYFANISLNNRIMKMNMN